MTGRGCRVGAACLCLLLPLTACWGGGGSNDPGSGQGTGKSGARALTLPADEVRYASPDGDDGGPGSRQQPWRTLARALPAMLVGQTLLVRGGVYRERLTNLRLREATERAPIAVLAYPGERPVVKGLVKLNEPFHWTFDGINVTWDAVRSPPTLNLLKIVGGVGWVWRNSEIWGARAAANVLIAGKAAGQPAHWSFEGNCVHDLTVPRNVQQGSNLAVGDMSGAGPGRITRNLVFDESLRGRNIRFGGDSGGVPAGPTDVVASYNTVYGATASVTLAGSSTGVRFTRNLVGSPRSGTLIRAGRLRGTRNVVQENLGVQAERFFRPNTGSLRPGPGNILLGKNEAGFRTGPGCDGLRPTTVASAYGRDAVG